jgi:hypothetical protein
MLIPKNFVIKCVLNRDAYLKGCILKWEATVCQRALNINANTQDPYLSKTWAYNLSIPFDFLPKNHVGYPNKSDYQTPTPIISGHHNVFGTQPKAIL